jgi:hypothetical protein
VDFSKWKWIFERCRGCLVARKHNVLEKHPQQCNLLLVDPYWYPLPADVTRLTRQPSIAFCSTPLPAFAPEKADSSRLLKADGALKAELQKVRETAERESRAAAAREKALIDALQAVQEGASRERKASQCIEAALEAQLQTLREEVAQSREVSLPPQWEEWEREREAARRREVDLGEQLQKVQTEAALLEAARRFSTTPVAPGEGGERAWGI